MLEIMRWISLGLSLFALCVSSYSCYFTFKVNKDLRRRNMDLFVKNVELARTNREYEAEIQRLNNLLKLKEKEYDHRNNERPSSSC